MESIERLEQIPPSLLAAENVAYIVIDGMRLDKKMMIRKAQMEAESILKNRIYLSELGIESLERILEL